MELYELLQTPEESHTEEVVGSSPEAKTLRRAIRRLSKIESNVLLLGETGTGRDFIAKQIYLNSSRRHRPFVKLNCSAIGTTLSRVDVLGEEIKERARTLRHEGLIERANGGVLFLDNLGDLSAELQHEIRQIIEEKRLRRVNGEEAIPLNVRIISSATPELPEQIEKGTFRKDLYYHLSTITIPIPALRERKQDIPDLFAHFLKKFCREYNKEIPAVPAELFESILEYDWKGNILELENCVHNLVLMSPEGELSPQFLPFKLKRHPLDFLEPKNLKNVVSEVEIYLIRKALNKFAGNQVKAARLLGIPEATLRFKMKKYSISRE